MSGAFDCLWWPQLVKDLESVKCRSSLIELTKSYLDGRQATMVIGDQTVTKPLNKGCPQGSEYSPNLWKFPDDNNQLGKNAYVQQPLKNIDLIEVFRWYETSAENWFNFDVLGAG
ncbi:hypothetical protein ACI65C_008887 [Semiaphis heraclei]